MATLTNRIGKQELVQLITDAMENQHQYVERSKGNDNPQVIELSDLAQGRADAFQAVLWALTRNERYGLRVYGAGRIDVSATT